MIHKSMFSTGKDDWETPDALFQQYDQIYHFVLDLAANITNHKVNRWLGPVGEYEDALTLLSWGNFLNQGNLWLNPPYSPQLQPRFVTRAMQEVRQHKTGHIVCLLPARTDTRLFHDVIMPFGTVTFLRGRLKFKGAVNSAPFPSMIVVFKA